MLLQIRMVKVTANSYGKGFLRIRVLHQTANSDTNGFLRIQGKNKTGFIVGSCRRSNTNEVLGRQWDRVNAMVLGWILNFFSKELFLGRQIFSKRDKHVWDKLKETYDKVDGSLTFSLHHKILTLSQNGSSIADYYHELNALWKQFDALIELPRSSILSRETLPAVRSAYAIISSEESHRIATGSVSKTSQRYPADFGKRKAGSNLKGKNVSNNVVGSSSSNGFSDEQMATLISLIKENFVNGKGFHANMVGRRSYLKEQLVVSELGEKKFRIQQYLQHEHYALWEVIEFGDSYEVPKNDAATGSASEGTATKKGRTVAVTTEDMQKRRNDVKARTTLLLALLGEHQLRFSKYKTAQELWAAILKTFGGNEATRKTKKNLLKQQYGNFKAEGKETLEQTFNRLQVIVSQLEFMDIEIEQDDLNQKFLTSLAPEWLMHIIVISLDTACAYIASQSNGSQIKYEDINQIDEDDIEISIQGTDVAGFDKSKVECFNFHKMGYFARECRAPRSQDRGRRDNYRQGSKVEEQAPKALMAIDGDMSWTGLPEFVNDTITNYNRPSPAIESTSDDLQNKNPSVTETGASDSTILSKPAIKFVKAVDRLTENKIDKVEAVKKPVGNFQIYIDDKGYWDSGCSRHKTGNISYLSDYEPFDERYVSFGQGGCKITGKGTIKTATGSASEGTATKKGRTVAVTTEDMQKRRNDVKARTTLLLALLDEHQLRFSKYKTAQELWAAILKTFGGNKATRKTKKNLLKQQYGNFKAEGKETLE
nr:ribonuclease H-like domain-containing protein [Tanacetum cinerariifolium]